ncbi:MAG: hypothetical protein LLG01_01570 [Planctomycetaceae bacterium]|nr:hypothetical protein [Planctomycetaceae bacterium]
MKQLMVIPALCAILVLTSGCGCGARNTAVATDASSVNNNDGTPCCSCNPLNCVHCPTPTDSAIERDYRVAQIQDLQDKQRVDDWDAFWLIDHSSRLSYWHAGFGHP